MNYFIDRWCTKPIAIYLIDEETWFVLPKFRSVGIEFIQTIAGDDSECDDDDAWPPIRATMR